MSELVIGGRRPARNRLRAIAITFLVLIVAVLVTYLVYRRLVAYAVPELRSDDHPLLTELVRSGSRRLTFGDASLEHHGAISVLRAAGDAHALGRAEGRLLANEARKTARRLAEVIDETVASPSWFGRLSGPTRLRWQQRLLDELIPGHQLVEMASVAASAHIDYESLVRSHAAFDVGLPPPHTLGHRLSTLARSLTVVAATRDAQGERLVVGRSFALPGVSTSRTPPLVRFIHAEGAIPLASIGWAGMAGVVTGVNADGIAITVHPVRTADVRVTRHAQPSSLIARDILENARTLDDATQRLKKSTPLGAAIYVIIDGKDRTWAVVERSPETTSIVKSPKQRVVTDLLAAKQFAEDPENDRARRARPSGMRAARGVEWLRMSPPTSAEDLALLLRDRRAKGGGALPLGHRGALDDLTAEHTAIIDPSTMVLWVSEGPGALGTMRAFDLRHELLGERDEPAPPADIPASTDVSLASANSVLQAIQALEVAARRRLADDPRGARDNVERALAFAADFPAALLLAGELFSEAGDKERADDYYRAFLSGGADDLRAKDLVEAVLGQR